LQAAVARFQILSEALKEGAWVQTSLDKDRRAEVARFGESSRQLVRDAFYHYASFGFYTHRVTGSDVLVALHTYRRALYDLTVLEELAKAGTSPEFSYRSSRIKAAVAELSTLLPGIQAASVRERATLTLARLRSLSRDFELKQELDFAIYSIQHAGNGLSVETPGVALAPSGILRGLP
jgi:hypothetical protein